MLLFSKSPTYSTKVMASKANTVSNQERTLVNPTAQVRGSVKDRLGPIKSDKDRLGSDNHSVGLTKAQSAPA